MKKPTDKKGSSGTDLPLSDIATKTSHSDQLGGTENWDAPLIALQESTSRLLRAVEELTVEEIKEAIAQERGTESADLRETGGNAKTANAGVITPVSGTGGCLKSVPENEATERLERFRKATNEAIVALSTDYPLQRDGLIEVFDTVRLDLAKALEHSLNAYAKTLPQDTYEDKKTVAKWINGELRRLGGLAIKCPKSREACIIVANTGRNPLIGRYVLQYRDEGGRLCHPYSCLTLPHLELTLDKLIRASHVERGLPSFHTR